MDTAVKSIDMCDSRASYGSTDFTKEDLVSQNDPYLQFNKWFRHAKDCDEIAEPNAMALATCSSSAIPSVRMVLMKWIGPGGVVFFTNQCSRKGSVNWRRILKQLLCSTGHHYIDKYALRVL